MALGVAYFEKDPISTTPCFFRYCCCCHYRLLCGYPFVGRWFHLDFSLTATNGRFVDFHWHIQPQLEFGCADTNDPTIPRDCPTRGQRCRSAPGFSCSHWWEDGECETQQGGYPWWFAVAVVVGPASVKKTRLPSCGELTDNHGY